MFLGMSRWVWVCSGLLVLLGLAGIATGNRAPGIAALVLGLALFAMAPTGPKRPGRGARGEATGTPDAPSSPQVQPIPPVAAAPRRTPLDIDAGDPSQV